MSILNEMKLEFPAQTANIGFARAAVAAFISQLDPTVPDLDDISTALSEAVTNAIVHGYNNDSQGKVYVETRLFSGDAVEITVQDLGKGIGDLALAREFGNTSQPEERVGIGFSLMEQCMDEVIISTAKDSNTKVQHSWFSRLLQSIGIGPGGGKDTHFQGPGTRITMHKHLTKPQD